MDLSRSIIHQYIFTGALLFLAASLPFSVFGISLSQIIILINFVLGENTLTKFKRLKNNYSLWIFVSIYLIHLIWLIPPQDFNYALNDLRIKLPLLIFPLLIVLEDPISKKTLKTILLVFVYAVFISSIISLWSLFKDNSSNIIHYRELSVFISHIRFSLMIVFSVFILFYYEFVDKNLISKNRIRFPNIIVMIWLTCFLLFFKVQTGLVIFLIILFIVLCYFTLKIKSPIKYLLLFILILLPLLPSVYIFNVYKKFSKIKKFDFEYADTHTVNGNEYSFNLNDKSFENGNLVWIYFCECELEKEWNKVSSLRYNEKDLNNNELKYTLIRYITSKGLRKDSVGFSKLNHEDINAVEKGIPNYIYLNKWQVYPIIYNFIWELYHLKNFNYANGHSTAQRIIYFETAFKIIKNNFYLGVGTGNVQIEFNKIYVKEHSILEKKWWHRAHNQYLTFLLTFGIFAFSWILFALFYPLYKQKSNLNFVSFIFLLIVFLSFLNEDTLETQVGLTFFVFFYSLFIFSNENINNNNSLLKS
jgi:hypothetical protein